MTQSPYRLLIVDAPGGPPPHIYLSMIPPAFEIQVILMLPSSPEMAKKRLDAVKERCVAYTVHDRSRLKDKIEEIARSWGAHGILAFSERVIHDVADVARNLGLPANPLQTQQALQDKELQRQLLCQAGLITPLVYRIEKKTDLALAAAHVGFPAVLKPIVGMGSLSVYEVSSMEELQVLYETAVHLYSNDSRVSSKLEFLLERKFVGARWHSDSRIGDQVSVESLVGGGIVKHLAVTDKLPLAYPFRETGDIMPSTLRDEQIAVLFEEADRAINALGITVGAVHTEIKLTQDGPRIIEVNGRIGGGITEMLYHASGYNVVEQLARLAVGELPVGSPKFSGYCGFFTPQPPADSVRLDRVPDVADLLSLPGVVEAEVVFPVGSKPDWRIGTGSNLARVIAVSADRESLMQLATQLVDLSMYEFIR